MNQPVSLLHEKTSFLSVAPYILPWLTPQELANLSLTCRTLSHLSTRITSLRSSDASRSLEPVPIPFINTLPHYLPYFYFLYTPNCISPSPNFVRQFWGSPFNPNPNPNFNFNSNSFGIISDTSAWCHCSLECLADCPCTVLRGGELGTECGPRCECDSSCGNRVTQKGVCVNLKIVMVENKGWGLFAAQFIPSAHFVCEYTGELLTTKEARRRQQEYDELSRSGLFSSALLVVREYLPSRKACFRINLDATRIGNVARFINHSCDGGNLSSVLIRSSGSLLPRVCFFSSRDIHEGEELSFSYGDVRLRPEGLHCYCGSSCCLGILPSEDT